MEYNVHMKTVIAKQENIMSLLPSILLRVHSMSKQLASSLALVFVKMWPGGTLDVVVGTFLP